MRHYGSLRLVPGSVEATFHLPNRAGCPPLPVPATGEPGTSALTTGPTARVVQPVPLHQGPRIFPSKQQGQQSRCSDKTGIDGIVGVRSQRLRDCPETRERELHRCRSGAAEEVHGMDVSRQADGGSRTTCTF